MAAWTDLTHFLTFQINFSFSGTCYFLDEQFRFIPRVVISIHSGLKLMSACIRVIPNPQCGYNLCTCMIPNAKFFIFRFLIIISAANMMFRYIVLMKPIPLMCMRSQKMVISLYLSSMFLVILVILTGSKCFAFWVWYAGPIYILSQYNIFSQDWKVLQDVIIVWMKDLLYWLTGAVIKLTFATSRFMSRALYPFFLSFTCGMGEC